jgi:LPS sulfotransferase NodH/DNA-binding CsgD family transcriptional regulator
VTSYIVAATPRTGSTLLCEGLVASRVAGNPQEVFEPMWEAEWRAEVGVSVDESYGHFIEAAKRYGTRGDVYGVKIQWMQVAPLARNSGFRGRPEDVLEHLFPGALFVHTVRRDRLAQSLSWFRAIETNEWWRWASAPPVKPPHLDADRVRALMLEIDRQQSEWLRYFHERGITALTVEYEDLASDWRGPIGRVLAFLGRDPAAAAAIADPKMIRQADDVTERWRRAMQRGPAGTIPTGYHLAAALTRRSRVAIAQGESGQGERDAHDALACAAELKAYSQIPDILECLAVLAGQAGRHREAARLFGAGDKVRQRIGMYPFKVYGLHGGRRLDDADYEASVAALRNTLGEQGFTTAWYEGASLSTEEAIAYAQRGRGERKRPTSGWAALAPAELDVVRLVSEGLGNNDIATRLFVSPRTVQSHLTHVYTKLGLTSRVRLAQEAVRLLRGPTWCRHIHPDCE